MTALFDEIFENSTKSGDRRFYSVREVKPIRIKLFVMNGAPGTTRTCDPLIRSQVLYPAELRVREGMPNSLKFQV